MTKPILPDWGAPPKTPPKVAEWLGVDRRAVYAAIKAGTLKAYPINGTRYKVIFEEDALAWIRGE